MNAMQQQAAAQMEFQTALMNKLVEALETPQRSVGRRSRSRARSRRDGQSSSGRSSRSRSRHAHVAYSSDEENDDGVPQAHLKSRASALEERQFPADGEVWIDEDQDSAVSSLPNSLPNSRPVSAASFNVAEQSTTPRMPGRSNRPQGVQRR